jgi:hypothetical protein
MLLDRRSQICPGCSRTIQFVGDDNLRLGVAQRFGVVSASEFLLEERVKLGLAFCASAWGRTHRDFRLHNGYRCSKYLLWRRSRADRMRGCLHVAGLPSGGARFSFFGGGVEGQ